MKNNFKKLTRDEQLMVNGGAFGPVLYCKKKVGGLCVGLAIPNGQPCADGQYAQGQGGLICSGYLGGSEIEYKFGNIQACVC
jgi:hypothetical protein